jgi:triacylglycerol esterase/lipase EstA (alpha/beta hydrolase family)
MGGLAARAWLAAHQEHRSRVQGIITIGSPHHGTWLARWSHLPNGRQMQQDSPWLIALARREREQAGDHAYRNFLCWYTPTDNIVFPASTATLPGADNRTVGGAAHVDLAFHPRVMTESLAMFASAGNSPWERTEP